MRLFRDNGLSIVVFAFFLLFWVGQAVAGWSVFNDEQIAHGSDAISFFHYLTSAHFIEATAENWESEFLQMGAYIALTAILFQRGSAESKSPDDADKAKETSRAADRPDAPRALRGPHWLRVLYSYSLSLAFAALFVFAFVAHAASGFRLNNDQLIAHGKPALSPIAFLTDAQFWFEALQNWQSEFLAVFAICILSIFLRHKGSPESKPVEMPHRENP